MSNSPAHTQLRGLRYGALVLTAATFLGFTHGVAARPATVRSNGVSGSYGWPVKPFDRPHPVRGGFGDPRTVFSGPPTSDGVLHGAGTFNFHDGIDISAPNGTPVYPVRDGRVTVASTEKSRERVVVACSDGIVFEYWHITPRVRVGQSVRTDETVLGTILRPAGHVHLTEVRAGRPVNPLSVGHLGPYVDATTPRVGAIGFRTDSGDDAMTSFVRGRIAFVAEASDTPAMPVPGIWHGMPVAPALLTWRIQTWNGAVVVPEQIAADFRVSIPPESSFWSVYARGTFQNMAVFGRHYSYLQPGCFLFNLTKTPFDTNRLRDGVYDLVVTATDIRGHSGMLTQRFSVHNRPGWVGT